MGVYSDLAIKLAQKSGHIVIHPYREEYVNTSSVDVTLGEWFYLTEKADNRDFYNPFEPEDVKRYFTGPLKAIPHKEWCQKYGRQLFVGIPENHPIIVLRPGERILAHTHEFIGINPPGTTEMKSRSTWGRNGIAACFDAGWGDSGYINRWTMEIYNLNQRESVPLPVGERIAQIIFHETGPVEGHYAKGGKYQTSQDIDKLVKSWRPEQMLPRAYKDSRKPLPAIKKARY
ncbi:deoxycytidine triphosphate deaminase [bacterium]|nr:deoxycytidine triphosphate deaminase [bacterium]